MNIFEKMSAISNDLSSVAKNLEVGIGAGKYKAVSEGDVLKAIKPLEVKYKVYSYPYNRSIVESGQLESVNGQGVVKKQLFLRIETTYRFVNMEDPKEYIDIVSYGDGIDTGDKATGKAMTYCDKYGLLKAYKIITGDDPDQEASQELKGVQTRVNVGLDKELIRQARELKISLQNVASYYKKEVGTLTNEELKQCIDTKRQALKGTKK